jgi:hypothetical protein
MLLLGQQISSLWKEKGFRQVNRDSVRHDLEEGAKVGNDPAKRKSNLALVKGVTDGLGDVARRPYIRYWQNYKNHTNPENTPSVGHHS